MEDLHFSLESDILNENSPPSTSSNKTKKNNKKQIKKHNNKKQNNKNQNKKPNKKPNKKENKENKKNKSNNFAEKNEVIDNSISDDSLIYIVREIKKAIDKKLPELINGKILNILDEKINSFDKDERLEKLLLLQKNVMNNIQEDLQNDESSNSDFDDNSDSENDYENNNDYDNDDDDN